MTILEKIDTILTGIEKWLLFILLILVIGATFWGVVARYILRDASMWAEELSRYLTVWATFVGASLGVKKNAHVGVDALLLALPNKARNLVEVIVYVLCFIFCIGVAVTGFPYVSQLAATNQLSPAMRIPMSIPYLAVPLGFSIMALRSLFKIAEKIKNFLSDIEIHQNSVKEV